MENSLPPHLLCQADWDAGREGGAEPLGIGLLGMGVVGSGLARVMTERGDWLAQRAGRPLALRRVLVRDTYKRRDVHLPHRVVTDRPEEVLADPDIHIVVEALGGTKPARELVLTAIEMGKHVVTANKALMAWHGREILEAAWQRGAQVRFEATVGGGVPVVGALWRGLAADRVTCVRGIVNGTTNYILSRMAKEGVAIEDALREAQRLGYAEPDPTSDVDGTDAACKLVILCRLAFGAEIRVEEVSREGILHLAPEDFAGAEKLGMTIKHVATAELVGNSKGADVRDRSPSLRPGSGQAGSGRAAPQDEGGVRACVKPELVPAGSLLGRADGSYNVFEVETELAGTLAFRGRGAGALPTASALAGDIVDIARGMACEQGATRRMAEEMR